MTNQETDAGEVVVSAATCRAAAHLEMTTVDAAVAPVMLRPPKWPDNQGD